MGIFKLQNRMTFFTSVLYLFGYLFMQMHVVNSSVKVASTRQMLKNLLEKVDPYQIAILTNKSERTTDVKFMNSIVEFIASQTTTLVFQTSDLKSIFNYKLSYQLIIQNPRQTTLFIIIFSKYSRVENLKEVLLAYMKDTFKFIVDFSTNTIRPHVLCILDVSMKTSEEIINSILASSWLMKILDFTISEVLPSHENCLSNLILQSFNPFNNTYTNVCYSSKVNIFPNKLTNMHKYQLTASLIRRPPAVDFAYDSNGSPTNISGTDYGYIVTVSDILNFSVKYEAPNITGYAEAATPNKQSLLGMIVDGKIDFSGNQVYTHLALINYNEKHGEFSKTTFMEDFVALVPVRPSPAFDILSECLSVAMNLFIHVIVITILSKTCKFSKDNWKTNYIFLIILAMPLPRLPKKSVERITVLSLIILACQYSTMLYARLTGIQMHKLNQGPFETLSDLDNFNMILETHENYKKLTFDDEDPLLQRLKRKVRLAEDIMNCPDRLLAEGNVACLIDKSVALDRMEKSNRCGRPKMKILKRALWSSHKGFVFSKASPYVLMFDKLAQRNFECGVWYGWLTLNRVKQRPHLYFAIKETSIENHTIRKLIVQAWLIGCIVASIAFISEIIAKRVNDSIRNSV